MAAASAPSAPLRVVIIGAGVAGLSAASCLKDAKFWKSKGHFNEAPEVEVVVLEARDRLGGRICTEHFADGTAVDLGAAWLHGNSASNPLLRLSKLCGAELVETDWDNALVFEAAGSEKEPEVKMEKISDEKLKKVEHIFSTLMKLYKTKQHADRKAATGESKDRSLMATLQELKSKKFKGIDSLDERTRLLLLSELDAVTEHDYAATPGELSTTWWDEDEEFPGGHSLWKHGFASLIEYLSTRSRASDHIRPPALFMG